MKFFFNNKWNLFFFFLILFTYLSLNREFFKENTSGNLIFYMYVKAQQSSYLNTSKNYYKVIHVSVKFCVVCL